MPLQHYIYNPTRQLTDSEVKVMRNYRYVSTTILGPHEGLGVHRHHGDNTHLIVRGSIYLAETINGQFRILRSTRFTIGQTLNIPANTDYMAYGSEEGCTFVEGHNILSPTTAGRFFGRETIVRAPGDTAGAFTIDGDDGCLLDAKGKCLVHESCWFWALVSMLFRWRPSRI